MFGCALVREPRLSPRFSGSGVSGDVCGISCPASKASETDWREEEKAPPVAAPSPFGIDGLLVCWVYGDAAACNDAAFPVCPVNNNRPNALTSRPPLDPDVVPESCTASVDPTSKPFKFLSNGFGGVRYADVAC